MHICGKISLCGFVIGIGLPQYLDRVNRSDLCPDSEVGSSALVDFDLQASLYQLSQVRPNFNSFIYFVTFVLFCVWILLAVFQYSKQLYETVQVFCIATILGIVFSIGLLRILASTHIIHWQERPFSIYICVMTWFHFTEYFVTSITNPANLEIDSFLLNHSTEYVLAAIVSWLEYFIESLIFPDLKSWHNLVTFGLAICVIGDALRKLAMLTASKNFSHIVQSSKVQGHELVTHGLYSWCRHPSYAGWFLWAVGTQIILLNPFCILAYTAASWRFFSRRIPYEEATLVMFFGNEYLEYQERTKFTGIPFVEGYVHPTKND